MEEVGSEKQEDLTNNNEEKIVCIEEEEASAQSKVNETILNPKKINDVKRGSTSDEGDINCSIVAENNVDSVDSGLKIKFKLQKKIKTEEVGNKKHKKIKDKSKAASKQNAVEKIGKLIIKDSHGEYTIKNMENKNEDGIVDTNIKTVSPETNNDREVVSSISGNAYLSNKNVTDEGGGKSLEIDSNLNVSNEGIGLSNETNENIEESVKSLDILRKNEIESEEQEADEKSKEIFRSDVENSDRSLNEVSTAQLGNEENNVLNHPYIKENETYKNKLDNEEICENPSPQIKNKKCAIGKKRKCEIVKDCKISNDLLCENNEKTDNVDCNKQITPWTKRRKVSSKKNEMEKKIIADKKSSGKSSASTVKDTENTLNNSNKEEINISHTEETAKLNNLDHLNHSSTSKRVRRLSSEKNEPKKKKFKEKKNQDCSNEIFENIESKFNKCVESELNESKSENYEFSSECESGHTENPTELTDKLNERKVLEAKETVIEKSDANLDETLETGSNLSSESHLKSKLTDCQRDGNSKIAENKSVGLENINNLSIQVEGGVDLKVEVEKEEYGGSDNKKYKVIPKKLTESNKTSISSNSDNSLKEHLWPQKSPKDGKKISLQDFLKELNEESKHIKEGDEILVTENEEPVNLNNTRLDQENDNSCRTQDENIEKSEQGSSTLDHENSGGDTLCKVEDNNEGENKDLLGIVDENGDENIIGNNVSQTQPEPIVQEDVKTEVKEEIIEETCGDDIFYVGRDQSVELETEEVKEELEIRTETDISQAEEYKKSSNTELDISQNVDVATELKKTEISEAVDVKTEENENVSGDLNLSSEDSSDSSDGSDSSDESSSSGSSSDSESSSDSDSESGTSDSESSDSESVRKKQVTPSQASATNVDRPKKLKIRNAPSLSQDSLHKSESSSNPIKDSESSNDTGDKSLVRNEANVASSFKSVPVRTLSQQILSDTPNTPPPVKRKPGRPRKNPLPDQGIPIPSSDIKPSYNPDNVDSEFRPQVCRRGRKKGGRKKKPGRKKKNSNNTFPIIKQERDPNAPRRGRGRPKKIRHPPESTDSAIRPSEHINLPSDQLSEQLMQLDSQLNLMVNSIPGITPVDDQNTSEITDNRLLEEINSGLDVITEEIVCEDVANYLDAPVNDLLQTVKQEPTETSQSQDDRNDGQYGKQFKTDDPNYHKRYYKYVKIPKDQQKKRGPKKRIFTEAKVVKKPKSERKRGRPRKSENLGARPVRVETPPEDDQEYDESLSKELENLNRSMENILTSDVENDKDFIVSAHVKFEALPEDQLKRSNRPSKANLSFSEFDDELDELIEMAATADEEKSKPKYTYYEKIPKHLQKKRGRPRKSDNPDEIKKEPKPKVERPPKVKKTIINEDGVEVKQEADDDEDYIEFDEEDDFDEDIDDEDKDKDFNIQEYLKKEKTGVQIDENLDYEEVYPAKERPIKMKKINSRPRMFKRFGKFGKFGKKIHAMIPRRNNVNACMYRFVTVCDKEFNPIAKVQRMYCTKVAPATYDIAERYRPNVKLKRLINNDITDFFEKYWCDQCELSFLNTKISKQRHMYIYHTEEVDCDLCDRTVSNRYNLKKHKDIFHKKKVYTCKVCEEEYKKFKTFQMHVWVEHPVVKNRDRAYFCNICQCVFYRKESFKFHYYEHLNGNIFEHFDTTLADIEFMLKQMIF